MDDFLGSFALFGMGLVLLLPLIVNGVKAIWAAKTGGELGAFGAIVAVFVVAGVLLAAHALVTYKPESSDFVKYALAWVLFSLSAMGLYSGVKAVSK